MRPIMHVRNWVWTFTRGRWRRRHFEAQSFDVVTLWDVFEHVLDPKATLTEIARILKPNGLVVIHTPNPTSLEARLMGANWVGWERPRHLHSVYADRVTCLFARGGFCMAGGGEF